MLLRSIVYAPFSSAAVARLARMEMAKSKMLILDIKCNRITFVVFIMLMLKTFDGIKVNFLHLFTFSPE